MPILYVVEVLIQIYFAVHAVKTGRPYYWLWIIIFFPGIGSVIYFIAEILPDLQANQRIKRQRKTTTYNYYSGSQIRELEKQVELTPSFKNKKDLADAYLHSKKLDQAIALLEESRQGAYKNDTGLLESLAKSYFYNRDLQKAKVTWQELMTLRNRRKDDDYDLLLARTYEELGETDRALATYEAIQKGYTGEEARCRYAMLLKKEGRTEEAHKLFEEIKKNIRLSPTFYKKAQREWLDIAQRESA